MGDPQMRNLEYALYVIFLVYVFKVFDTFFVLLSYKDYDSHLIPATFIPMGALIVFLHVFLLVLTLAAFAFRKKLVGNYNFENINEHVEPWD